MQATKLSSRGVVRVSGADAAEWLQGLITNDIARAGADEACFAALLTPQGKILFDFLIHRRGEEFLVDCPAGEAAALARRLSMYRLRAKVEVADASAEHDVFAVWDAAERPAPDARRDPRHRELGWRLITGANAGPIRANATQADYAAHRIALGTPEGGVDFRFGEVFPHDVNMDELGGVDFRKGCYVGQEVVSRVQHRGTARKRVRKLCFGASSPAPGSEIVAGDKPLGEVIAVAGSAGLGLLRIDRATESMAAGARPHVNGETIDIDLAR